METGPFDESQLLMHNQNVPCDGLACDDLTFHKSRAVLTKLLLLRFDQLFKARPEDRKGTLVGSCVRCSSRKRQRDFAELTDRQKTEPKHILFGTLLLS